MTETNTTARQNTEIRALRMLRAGDSVKDVCQATGLTADEVEKLKRDFPGGPTLGQRPPAPAVMPSTPVQARPELCQQAACKEEATQKAGPWAFCDKHAADSSQNAAPTPASQRAPGRTPLTLGELLEECLHHQQGQIRSMAQRVEREVERLRQRHHAYELSQADRRRAEQEKAKARAEVDRLERELAAAKAALRGKPAPAPATGDITCRKGCGRSFAHGGARGKHEKSCAAGAAA